MDVPAYETLEWANNNLDRDEFVEAQKYAPGQSPPMGEYLDARTGELVIIQGHVQVPSGTFYLSVDSLREHGSYTL